MMNFNNLQDHEYQDSYFYTYELIDSEDNKSFYVGYGKGDRMLQHVKEAEKKCNFNLHKENKIRKIIRMGGQVKYNKILENVTEDEAKQYEQFMIAIYGREDIKTGILTNHTDGGDGHSGGIPWNKGKTGIYSEEQIKNLSEKTSQHTCFKGSIQNTLIEKYGEVEGNRRWLQQIEKSKTTKRKMFDNGTLIPGFAGKKHSEESKDKNRQKHLGKKSNRVNFNHSTESKEKISSALAGRIPWNKGLTKETDFRVEQYGKKQKITKESNKGEIK